MAQAVTTTPLDGDFEDTIASEAEVNTTASENMFNGSATIYAMSFDNTGNAQTVYYRAYDKAEVDPTSDVPDMKVRVAASTRTDIIIADGVTFPTAFSLRCTSATDDADTTGPSTPGPAYFVAS